MRHPAVKKGSPELAAALRFLKRLHEKHQGVVYASDISEGQRGLLMNTGFPRPIMKGWYVCGNPRDGMSNMHVSQLAIFKWESDACEGVGEIIHPTTNRA